MMEEFAFFYESKASAAPNCAGTQAGQVDISMTKHISKCHLHWTHAIDVALGEAALRPADVAGVLLILAGVTVCVHCKLLHRTLFGRRIFSSHQIVNCIVYLCSKFGALNRRTNENRSSENRSGLLPQGQPPRFSILPITWLYDLSPKLNRASRTVMDTSQHASSAVYASWPSAIKRPQHHTLD